MDDIQVVSSIGNIGVETQNYRGHPPEWWAEKCTDKICGISENAQGHIRQQAEAYRLAIYSTILYHIKQAINSERCTMKNVLTKQGHDDLAKLLTEIK
jgi:hypothetical protein